MYHIMHTTCIPMHTTIPHCQMVWCLTRERVGRDAVQCRVCIAHCTLHIMHNTPCNATLPHGLTFDTGAGGERGCEENSALLPTSAQNNWALWTCYEYNIAQYAYHFAQCTLHIMHTATLPTSAQNNRELWTSYMIHAALPHGLQPVLDPGTVQMILHF